MDCGTHAQAHHSNRSRWLYLAELYAARLLFVALTIALATLDVDAAFLAGHTEPTAMAGALVVLVGWFGAYAWLARLVGSTR